MTRPNLLPAHTLVDPECGVVQAISDFPRMPGLPHSFLSCVASVSDTRRFAVWLADRIAAGTSFGDRGAAWMGALGEAVERYCGNNIPEELILGSAAALRADGHDVIAGADLPSFTGDQLAQPGFPYRPLDEDLEIRWARGTDAAGDTVLVPGSWVYLNWHQGSRRSAPRNNHLNYTGIATGAGLQDAAERALAECIERDAVVAWWLLDLPAIPVDPWSIEGFADDWAGCPFEVKVVALPSEFGVPVMGALVLDGGEGIPAAGFSSNADPARAARKAIQEALQVWIASRGLVDADGASYRAIDAGVFARRAYLPFRADRRYLDDAGKDFSLIRDLAAQTQLWLDDRLHPMLARFDGSGPPGAIDQIPGGSLEQARALLRAAGHRIVTVDLTTSDVAETELAVARVLAVGLLPNAPAAYPYLGTPRLAEVARRHGRAGFVPALGSVTLAPPPHN